MLQADIQETRIENLQHPNAAGTKCDSTQESLFVSNNSRNCQVVAKARA